MISCSRSVKRSGLTQKELGQRLGKAPEIISRLLARPGNWEADTFAELLFGISGAVASYRSEHPLKRRSYGFADLLNVTAISSATRGPFRVTPTDTSTVRTATNQSNAVAA